MRVATVVGARPQFIKAAPVSAALERMGHQEVLIHTGQHYDTRMSKVFFDELRIPAPTVNLGVGSGPHGRQTAEMITGIERVLADERPDCVVVYGDTNSTLAGAIAACKTSARLAHVEAGLRSFNRSMPEEHNRVLTDHCADLLFCPTETAVRNLAREGIDNGVFFVGDTMYESMQQLQPRVAFGRKLLEDIGVVPHRYLLATIHRASNTDDDGALRTLVDTLSTLGETVVFPVHPRTAARMASARLLPQTSHLKLIEPVSYIEMLALEQHARLVLTDSGGVQKEAFFFGTPCVTLRGETEWVETVEAGMNVLVGTNPDRIREAVQRKNWPETRAPLPHRVDAAAQIVAILAARVDSQVPAS
jgi:UDP-N-acetylglucosamine 2-epimerase